MPKKRNQPEFSPSRSVVAIMSSAHGHSLDALTWEALGDIARREGISATELLQEIAAQCPPSRLPSATRIFIVDYYRSLCAEALERCDSN
jgi:predicted DNA-binding ribbon-helix-helix protein